MEIRINEIKNTSAMRKVAEYKGKEYTNLELKEALMDVQEQLLRTTFEQKHAENLSYNDLYNYFKSVAADYNLTEDEHYIRFSNELKTLKGTIGTLIAGEIGEKRVANALRLIELDGSVVISNLELQATDHDHTEIDYLVINKSGVHMLEVKNYRHDIEITDKGEIIEGENATHTYSLGTKCGEKEFAIKQILSEAGIDALSAYENILVIADNRTTVTDNYGYIPVCYVGNIVNQLRSDKDVVLSASEIERIAQILKEAHHPNKYCWDAIDFEQLVNDYAYLMAYVESASNNEYEKNIEEVEHPSYHHKNKKDNIAGKCIASAIGGAAVATVFFVVKSII